MSTGKETHDYILENLRRAGNVTTRRMMGEYLVYFDGKLVGDICDGTLLLKQTPSSVRLLDGAELTYPYEGSKTLMLAVEDFENAELMREVLTALYGEL